MNKTLKRISSLALSGLLAVSLTFTAYAADSTVTYNGRDNWSFNPGSGYTTTDLFDGFKNVMPGDVLTEKIDIKNEAQDCDYIKVYLQALPHDETGNPLTYDEDFEEADGKASESNAERDETVVTMADFLSQLTMRVYNGEVLIYEGSPDETDGLASPVCLTNKLRKGQSVSLDVELAVPIELGNEYAYRVGEVDWKITIEEFDDPSGGGDGGGGGPSDGGESTGSGPGLSETTTILPLEIRLTDLLPQTGTLWWLVPILAIAGIMIFLGGMIRERKKDKNEISKRIRDSFKEK